MLDFWQVVLLLLLAPTLLRIGEAARQWAAHRYLPPKED